MRFRQDRLKRLRVWVSLAFFIPVSLIFLDRLNAIPEAVSSFFTSIQIIPALARTIVYGGGSLAGLIVVLAATVLFGRIYCSSVCPLGTFQDVVIRISRKLQKRKRFRYGKPMSGLHYAVLAVAGVMALSGSMVVLNTLEPFSNFGRMITGLVEPLVLFVNNGLAGILGQYGIYAVDIYQVRIVGTGLVLMPLVFTAVVTYMAYRHGRLFCNSLCPAGALLGLVSRFTLFRISIDHENCTECGACEKVCKAQCIDSPSKRIDFRACVGCFNCIDSCPTEGIAFTLVTPHEVQRKPARVNSGRRAFFSEVGSPALALVVPGIVRDTVNPATGYGENRNHPLTPPGSKSRSRFTNLCTACHLCVSACPSQVLYPSFLEYGLSGMFQPRMSYDHGYCNYDCVICSRICPSGAILPLDMEAKKLIQIGKAVFVKDDCVVVTKKKDCGACSEHCPTKAVRMVPYEGRLAIPELNNDVCVGCGACEHACPTTPRRAIYVASNAVHLVAKKPRVEQKPEGFDPAKDFPF
jgi:ferredoxin